MNFTRTARLLAAVTAVAILATLPLNAFAGHASAKKKTCPTTSQKTKHVLSTAAAQPAIVFGVSGGNIRPWNVTINGDGTVTAQLMAAHNQRLVSPQDTLNGLSRLADAEGFWTMPASTACQGTLPDIAWRYIQINSSSGSKKVAVHGGCVPAFNELFAVLANTVDLQH